MTYVVGLTGGIGSGKSMVADLFTELKVPLIDADIVARQAVEKGSPQLAKIVEHFGESVLNAEGELNRARLRQIVFADEKEKNWLNNLLHPVIREEMIRQIRQVNASYVLFVVPLLIENKLTDLCDRVLVIDVSPEIQLERVTKRDQSKIETVKNIMAAQVSREERLNYADDVVENNCPLEQSLSEIKVQVRKLHRLYLALAEKKEKECQKLL